MRCANTHFCSSDGAPTPTTENQSRMHNNSSPGATTRSKQCATNGAPWQKRRHRHPRLHKVTAKTRSTRDMAMTTRSAAKKNKENTLRFGCSARMPQMPAATRKPQHEANARIDNRHVRPIRMQLPRTSDRHLTPTWLRGPFSQCLYNSTITPSPIEVARVRRQTPATSSAWRRKQADETISSAAPNPTRQLEPNNARAHQHTHMHT